MKNNSLGVAVALIALAVLSLSPCVASDDGIVAITDTESTRFWNTVDPDGSDVSWDWPQGAVRANLEIVDGTHVVTNVFDAPVSHAVVVLPAPASEDRERTVLFRLSFLDPAGGVLAGRTLTARLGLVCGVNGRPGPVKCEDAAAGRWRRSPQRVLLSLPPGGQGLAVDGEAVTPGRSGGYFDLRMEPGWHVVTFVRATGEAVEARILVSNSRTVIILV